MPRSDDGRDEVATQDAMEPLKPLVFTQDRWFQQLEERLASGGARREGESNPGTEDRVQTCGSWPAPDGLREDEAIDEFGEGSCVNVGPREFSCTRDAVPTFCGKPENFPLWNKRFEASVSMSWCLECN